MRVAMGVGCKAVMEIRRKGAKYVYCPNPHCRNWFPVSLVNRRHRDGEINAVWQLYTRFIGRSAVKSWERVSKARKSKMWKV